MNANHFQIGLISYFFYPVNNPRANRTLELAKEFSRLGIKTAVIIPDLNQDISNFKEFSIIKVPPGYYKNTKEKVLNISSIQTANQQGNLTTNKKSWIKIIKAKLVTLFYPGAFNFEFGKSCPKELIRKGYQFDNIISIGLPICSHFAASNFYRKSPIKPKVMIADYGDPYSFNQAIKPPHIHRYWEYLMLKNFKYISVPVNEAQKSFLFFKALDKIKVIPQGVNLNELKKFAIKKIKRDNKISFMYAGVFYESIRDPFELINYLSTNKSDFIFRIYTDLTDPINQKFISQIIEKIPSEKLHISKLVSRSEAISEMANSDFLINIENTTSNQIPSKIIDYLIADRPVFSYKPSGFNPIDFEKFLNGEYENDYMKKFDLNTYNIEKVAKQFIELMTISR